MRVALATESAAETAALGRRLGGAAPASGVLTLSGALGAGKTVLAQGVLEGLGVPGPHPSPTFTIVRRYAGRAGPVWHIDAYRLGGPEDLGWDEVLEGLALIEWPDALIEVLPADRLELSLTRPVGGERREIELVARGPAAAAWLERALVTRAAGRRA
jgi:tRNA threonylcarbamoyladenosine biosynthesis protein TsaE